SHINLPSDLPGIVSLMKYRPDTGKLMSEFTEILLQGESPLLKWERELIATYVSHRNECNFCKSSHGAIAKQLLKEQSNVVDAVYQDVESADLSEKMKALLKIAAKVQLGGKQVTAAEIQQAKEQQASDREIHDTVLIAAAFCMFNRYVDGLAATTPEDPSLYQQMTAPVIEKGYTSASQELFDSETSDKSN
ncbi:MAG: peroxidase-related enzyme, partial [Oscillatoria sp. PMC 1076.18]|nr:peroxidase-related enzyme [Oscillatoria sp. PMC 1076.18]